MNDKPKVLIVATHPVQYQAPWFRYLHEKVTDYTFEVLYITIPNAKQQGTGFGQAFEWDVPLLDGYNWKQLDTTFLAGDGNLDKFSSLRIKNPKKLIKQLDPSAAFLTGWQCLALVQLLYSCNYLKIPTLIRGDSNNLKPRKKIAKLVHRKLIKHYDKFLAVGKANKNFYLENGAQESDIFFCPHFIDNQRFLDNSKPAKEKRLEIRDNYNIAENSFCFCYVGKLNPKKRIMDVLEAIKRLTDEQVHLLVVGDGELMQQAKYYVDTHHLNVTFTGFLNQSEIAPAYAISDCLILVSDYDETWGLVVNEAMASGLPAIVSDRCGCHPDLITDGITGYQFEFANITNLVTKMKLMISLNKEKVSSLGEQGQKNVVENYSIKKATDGLTTALNNCVKPN